ncbi:hypothetical protein GWI33_004588 [Rhynchophorus ferrugineus]|uniref:Uncharacterized protein n=1 Tax=Rhynchophorus ferrugineus TaxID=354439 RepID=A0A834II51_RHYFE|nr:hypothetical protein GWI33_004588 [Rhynchophorus ferrugineus]
MSGDESIKLWWPNYPYPVQMYLVWGKDNQPTLMYNDAELMKNYFNRPVQFDIDEERPLVIDEDTISEHPAITEGNNQNTKTVTTAEVQGHQDKEKGWMRPHKKRPFLMDLERRECRLDLNVADDNQDDALYQNEENDKDKDKEKDEMPRGRKRWKRKISRKQFRHHDIKLFTPCEYKTTSMLKQKEPGLQDTQKPEAIQKESITDAIVHSLAGQKQQVLSENNIQKRLKVDDAADAQAKTNLEENNNIATTHNHNSTGKHNLPAIIMETPPASTRSTRSMWPKNLIDCYQNSNKFTTNQEPVTSTVQQAIPPSNPPSNSIHSQEQTHPLQHYGEVPNFEPSLPVSNISPPTYMSECYFNTPTENSELNKQMDMGNHENEQPEDLSVQIPVDLSKKTAPSPNRLIDQFTEDEPVHSFIAVNNSSHSSKSSSPETITATALHNTPSYQSKQWYCTDPTMISHVHHIMAIFDEIRHILLKPFSDEMNTSIQYVYNELKKTKENEHIPIQLKIEAQNLASEVEKYIIARPKANPLRDIDHWPRERLVRRPAFRQARLPDVPKKYNAKRPPEIDLFNGNDPNFTMYRNRPHKLDNRIVKPFVRRTMSYPETIEEKTDVALSAPYPRSPNWNHLRMYPPMLPPPNPILNVPPNAYSDVFFKNIHNYIANGNPLPVSVHPHMGSNQVRQKSNSQGITMPPHNKTPPAILNTNEREDLPVLPPPNYTENVTVTPTTPPSPLRFSPPNPPKKTSIPAVIVADNSMEITKEPNESVRENFRIQLAKDKSPTPETKIKKVEHVFNKDPEENSTELSKWLEKLKSDEKLKNEFLSKMGINKESEPDKEKYNDDTIEIVDSDDENPEPPKVEDVRVTLRKQVLRHSLESPPVKKYPEHNKPNTSHNSLPNIKISIPVRNTIQAKTSPAGETKVSSTTEASTTTKPPPTTDVSPVSTAERHRYFPTLQNKEKVTYSPQIEPISPVGNETSFVFPDLPSAKSDKTMGGFFNNTLSQKNMNGFYKQLKTTTGLTSLTDNWKSIDRPQAPCSPRVAPHGKLRYIRDNHMFIRYFDDTQVALFNLSIRNDEHVKAAGVNPNNFSGYNKRVVDGTEIIKLPRDVEFSRKEDLREVEEFVKERTLVEKHVPKDFADFYIYVTGFQIVKMNPPVSLQTFLAMYNTNRTTELLKKYLEKIDVSGPVSVAK